VKSLSLLPGGPPWSLLPLLEPGVCRNCGNFGSGNPCRPCPKCGRV
jgi:hypothetical protein